MTESVLLIARKQIKGLKFRKNTATTHNIKHSNSNKYLSNREFTRHQGRQRGYSLIEVLVSMFILAFGMLGVAKLQLNSLQNVQDAHFSHQASLLTGQIVTKISANTNSLSHYQLNINDTIISPINCQKLNCGSALLAKFDLQQWQQQISKRLPAGNGQINTTSDSVEVIVRWDSTKNGASGTSCPPISATDLSCLKLIRRFP